MLALLVLRLRFPHYCPRAELCDPFNPRNVSRRDIQGGRSGPRLWHQLAAVTSPGLCCPSPGERPRVGLAVGTSCWVPPPPAVLDTNTRTGDPRGGHEHAPASPGGTPAAPCAPGLCSLSSSSAAGGPAATSWGTPMRQSQAPHGTPERAPSRGTRIRLSSWEWVSWSRPQGFAKTALTLSGFQRRFGFASSCKDDARRDCRRG